MGAGEDPFKSLKCKVLGEIIISHSFQIHFFSANCNKQSLSFFQVCKRISTVGYTAEFKLPNKILT